MGASSIGISCLPKDRSAWRTCVSRMVCLLRSDSASPCGDSSRFVGRVLRHSKGALVVAEENCGFALSESEIPQEHPEIECFFGALCLRAVLCFLGG